MALSPSLPRSELLPLPRELYIESTTRCNEFCDQCPRTHLGREADRDINLGEVRSIVEQFPVLDRVVLHGLAEVGDGGGKIGPAVREPPRRQEQRAEEVGQHPFGVVFVAIKAGKAEVGGAGPLNAVVEVAAGLVQGGCGASRARAVRALVRHGSLREQGKGHPHHLGWQLGWHHYAAGLAEYTAAWGQKPLYQVPF